MKKMFELFMPHFGIHFDFSPFFHFIRDSLVAYILWKIGFNAFETAFSTLLVSCFFEAGNGILYGKNGKHSHFDILDFLAALFAGYAVVSVMSGEFMLDLLARLGAIYLAIILVIAVLNLLLGRKIIVKWGMEKEEKNSTLKIKKSVTVPDIRDARYIEGSDIEIVNPDVVKGAIRFAIFDNDGTLSVLREGWEQVMEPVMLKSILGDRYDDVDAATYQSLKEQVQAFIDDTTGIQTILQMEKLVDMVKSYGHVPESKMLDKFGYKAIYNEGLLAIVDERLLKIERNELDYSDFLIKGCLGLLDELRKRRVKMYLASGTDREDVINEITLLGAASYFETIYGSVGDVSKYSKKLVVEKMIQENKLNGPELIVFGDGPVEIREVKRKGGIAVGVASDEVRRFGLNLDKRKRLINAGADFIMGDYTQQMTLIKYLFEE